MADLVYDSFPGDVMTGAIDMDTDDIYIMLVTSSYTPDAAHNRRDDITNEVTSWGSTGYTAGGQSLGTVTKSVVSHVTQFDATDPTWDPSTITGARWAIIYANKGGASSADPLIVALDLGADRSSVSAEFTIQFNAAGFVTAGPAS